MSKPDNKKRQKGKVELDVDVIQHLMSLKQYGETYSDVIRRTTMQGCSESQKKTTSLETSSAGASSRQKKGF